LLDEVYPIFISFDTVRVIWKGFVLAGSCGG
jgi:hypothetical protein